jgi:hypothetical protein
VRVERVRVGLTASLAERHSRRHFPSAARIDAVALRRASAGDIVHRDRLGRGARATDHRNFPQPFDGEKPMQSPSSHTSPTRRRPFLHVARPERAAPSGAEALRAPQPESTSAARPASGRAAVIVVHGMGQQLPFETLDGVVDGLRRIDRKRSSRAAGEREAHDEELGANVRLARLGDVDLPRAELRLGAGTDRRREVHFYEAYWAPLTEGEIGLRDVMRFLWHAARDGRRNARAKGGFERFMFDRVINFGKQVAAGRELALTLLVMASLVVLNAATAGIFAATVLGSTPSSFATPTLVAEITLVVAATLALAIACALLMFAVRRMGFFLALLWVVVTGGGLVAAAIALDWFVHWHVWNADADVPRWLLKPLVTGLFWALVFAASLRVRELLVQYVGDVAIYITPHELDRFYELRQKIKEAVRRVVGAVYGARDGGSSFVYDRVVIVGHSLGSVAAYDALNESINSDVLGGSSLRVIDRTCLLLTFGSPLDKTAFVFTSQGYKSGDTREALAAAVQPLIQSYDYRTFPWVNVYSQADIISGSLEFYDDPEEPARKVVNVEDKEARTPIEAHTEYWKTDAVFERLHDVLAPRSPAS